MRLVSSDMAGCFSFCGSRREKIMDTGALVFLTLGLALGAMIWMIERRYWNSPIRFVALLASLGLCVFLLMIFREPVFLGETAWYERRPFRELILFLLMTLGMMAYGIRELARRKRRRVQDRKWNWWEIAYPLLIAVPTFAVLLTQARGRALDAQLVTLAFQTGFFWKAMLAEGEV